MNREELEKQIKTIVADLLNIEEALIKDGSQLYTRKYKDDIMVSLKLENTSVSLFDRAEDAYEKYTRFELMDL